MNLVFIFMNEFSFSSVKNISIYYYRLIIINSYFWRLFKKEVSSIHLSSGVRGVFFLKKETIEEFLVYMDSQKILIFLQKQQRWRQSQPLLHFIWNSSILKGRLLVINPSHFHTLSLNII